jgi:hypothetical protein
MLSVTARCFVAMNVMHCVAVELSTMLSRTLSPSREASVIALAIVEMMIHVSVEVFRPVEPRSRSEEYTA